MEYNEENEQLYNAAEPQDIKPAKGKKHRSFGQGIAIGLLLGCLILGIGAYVGLCMYADTTGNYLIISPKGAAKTSDNKVLNKKTIGKIEELLAYIDLYYNDEYDADDVRDAIYEGALSGLGDPYSVYYTADDYKDLQITTSGNYYGIGAALAQNANTMEVTVSKVYEGTPAEKAGLLDGDQILKVDDIEATSMELSNLVKNIRGEEGTTVHLQVYRASTKETFEVDVERANVDLPSVSYEMLDDGVGYIQISEFQSNTAKQFRSAVKDLKHQDMKGMIVDVRSNPGGLITSVVDILDQILPEGTVVYTEDKYGKREDYTSDSNCLKLPIAVLVNENSASASEIFAGAIKDYNYGTLIGTKTFGKGIVQTVYPLEDGDAIKITTAKYYTPKGNYIHKVGIEPDIEVEYKYSGPKDEKYDKQYDNQFEKAVQVLEEEIK